MKKEIITQHFDSLFDFPDISRDWLCDGECLISIMIDDLKKIQSMGATHVKIKAFVEYHGDSPEYSFDFYTQREETDEEYERRLRLQKLNKKGQDEAEKRLYERLKLKYEPQ